MAQKGVLRLDIFIDGLDAKKFGEAIVRSDASACTFYYRTPSSARWKGKLEAAKWDGKDPPPPTIKFLPQKQFLFHYRVVM